MPPSWLKKIEEFLSEKRYKKAREEEALKDLLDQLRAFRDDLKAHLAEESRPKKRKRIEKKLAAVHAQRKKALKTLKKLRDD